MKVHWFSVLSVAGIVLLSGNSFGNELHWKKPVNGATVVPSVTHIPTIITTDDMVESPTLTQVQRVEPMLPPRLTTPTVPPFDRDYPDSRPQSLNPLPGATLQEIPSTSPYNPPSERSLVSCSDQIGLKSIREISHDIRPPTADDLPAECVIDSDPYYGRHFEQSCFMWKASALSTKAAYFEDVQLERHGHTLVCPVLQPVVSGAKFFATIPLLPYKMGVTPPNECVYTLGHYRAGSCAPYMIEPLPISPRGVLFQAGAVTGTVFAIP